MGTSFHGGLTGKPGRGLPCWGLRCGKKFWDGFSPYRDNFGGTWGKGVCLLGTLRDEGGSRDGASLSEEAQCRRY